MDANFSELVEEYYKQAMSGNIDCSTSYTESYHESGSETHVYYDQGDYSESVSIEDLCGDY